MSEILSLGKSQYLGEINYLRQLDGLVASAVAAGSSETGSDALHYHENPIISFILEGDSLEFINRRRNVRAAGNLRFYRAGDLHQVEIKRFPSRILNFEIDRDFLIRSGFSEERIGRALENNPRVRPLFLRAYREFSANDAFSDAALEMLLLGLLGGRRGAETGGQKPRWATALGELLNDRWNEPLDLAELAAAVGVHPVTISKYFTRYFGCSFGEYRRRLRVDKSLPLVKKPRLSLTEAALLCGFADQSHFTRNFKEFTGFLPKDFRKL